MTQPTEDGGLMYPESPSQTAGPYVHIGLALEVAGLPPRDDEIGPEIATPDAEGEPVEIVGRVIDGNGDTVEGILVEAWQADANGVYQTDYRADRAFRGFGRSAPGEHDAGEWSLHTIKPGRVPHPNGDAMAPHINLMLFARGINIHLNTRLYFDDEADANAACPFLTRVPPSRRDTLIATRENGSDKPRYRFEIHLQGPQETVFFDF
ncbi:protocatechuate 3,4-dioxygenase subunit alpha [Salinisphaera orenii MK-B5]|uniref:Protocatechuate 3,4-dioxygenase subunit alpha n=1 Tax=Salinisphaera orenii MK-B5 TaxID=856730 RepID=A0A423PPW0_9GAMM|nr:protocatechuate 3,4-dioxygenase subunit alpha [Salinisphaera orenii]ROO27623.1 protocatechuate 3,4-dioxygenase subunit alpha [Salinisphaera orenii MK-B5]